MSGGVGGAGASPAPTRSERGVLPMQGQASAPVVVRRGDEAQFMLLALLLEPGGPAQWSLVELAREIGCELAAAEAVVRLHAAGPVHRSGGFVFASRAASRFCQLLRE
jgi:hypothetical protein